MYRKTQKKWQVDNLTLLRAIPQKIKTIVHFTKKCLLDRSINTFSLNILRLVIDERIEG